MFKELTPMQGANWVGRRSAGRLGDVAAHLYAEFDGGDIDAGRLQRSIDAICRLHPMLQLRVDADGRQHLDVTTDFPSLEVEDLSRLAPDAVTARLTDKRRAWSGRKLAIESGQAAAFGLSLLPDGACRLHVDTDMIAVDPNGFRIVVEDLARLYALPESVAEPAAPEFFQWLDLASQNAELGKQRERDKAWWRARLADMPPAPDLPIKPGPAKPKSERLAALLSPRERRALEWCARSHRVTVSVLALGLLAAVLGRATGTLRFRLNVPMFWRAPLIADVDRIVGDFSNFLILGVDLGDIDTLAELCRSIGGQMGDLLAHGSYSGVNVMRDLSRHHGTVQTAPVVFTAGLGLPGRSLFSAAVERAFGRMNWVISQGPQVAIDVQVVDFDGGILVNWDVRLDALPEAWVRATFNSYVALLRKVAASSGEMDAPWDNGHARPGPTGAPMTEATVGSCRKLTGQSDRAETALTDLQQAYLIGRERHLPLGGVAMQEFREYRGPIDVDALPDRLIELVKRHDSLRTTIDGHRRVQNVSSEININYDEVDLRDCAHAEALRRIDGLREDYAHRLFHLSRPLWNVTAFRLRPLVPAETDHGFCVLFLRFDALILDGHSIASLLVELIDGGTPGLAQRNVASASSAADDATKQRQDADYWNSKLEPVEGPPQLPWKKPLPTIAASRYDRESLSIDREHFASLCRLAARERLFKNTAVTALVLEMLTPWLSAGALCVGIPVAPTASPDLANRSSFIAIYWNGRQGSFVERARALQRDVLEGLEHLSWSGVHISRLLMNANPGELALPVVITNGLAWPLTGKASDVHLHGGLTQTPQVAMDIRFSKSVEGHLVIDIDHAREAIDRHIVRDILAAIERGVTAILARGVFDVAGQEHVELGHYLANSADDDFAGSGFLRRIADHLFTGYSGVALIFGERQIGYAELGASVGQVLRSLRERGIGQGCIVAICLARSPEHTAVALACALSGVIWVPIDAGSPPERLDYLFANCRPDLIVAARDVAGYRTVTPEELLAVERLPDIRDQLPDLDALSSSSGPAYYLYTSGTTGRPKCVVLSNRATSNVIGQTLAKWQIDRSDVFMSVTPLHHDMSVFDVFGCLAAGATLVLPLAVEAKDAVAWNRLVAVHRVTIWCSVPAILEMLLAGRRGNGLASLRLIAQGGDYIKPAVIGSLRQRHPALRLISLGGPTETTIWSIWHEILPEDVDLIPYGRPLPGNSYFVLNERGEHCPRGTVGRIHTAGVNVALGYLQNGALDQTDFVTVLNEKGLPVRAFRTGDRGLYRPDGTIVFAGRVDGYIKVRGVRVSLPDIENALVGHPDIRTLMAVDYGAALNGETEIGVLYVCGATGKPDATALRAHARAALPDSHVPTRFVDVGELPLTANGKPDRRKARELLAAATDRREQRDVATTACPANPRARKILDLYLSMLDQTAAPDIDCATDFTRMELLPSHLKPIAGRLRDTFDVALTPHQLLRCRNAEQVEQLLRNSGC